MSSPSELVTIDTNGDIIITLWPRKRQDDHSPMKVRFLVSSRQLRSASRYFDNMLRRDFSEATPSSTDGRHHVSADDFHEYAFGVVMLIVHSQT